MSKTITIRQEQKGCYSAIRVDVADFADFVQRMSSLPIDAIFPSAWVKAGLLVMGDHGVHVLTPRGEDLLASAHLIPDDHAPEQPSAPPCEACNGTGEQMLLVSTHVCDVCHGSKVKPQSLTNPCRDMPAPRPGQSLTVGKRQGSLGFSVTVHNEPDGTLIKTEHHSDGRVVRLRHNAHGYWVVDSITTPEAPSPEPNPWVLIDSEAVARSFVGKDVEVDAHASGDYPQSGWHGSIMHVEYSNDTSLFASIGDIAWRLRGNVRLRVVGGSDV